MKRAPKESRSRAGSRERWQALLSEFERSNQTAREFCRSKGVSESAFSRWKRQGNASPVLRFVPAVRAQGLQSAAATGRGGLVLELAGSRVRIEAGFDRELLVDVVRTLQGAVR